MMHSMNWDDLKILDVCTHEGSFTKAAKALGMNHTSVSRRISHLERDCGFTVLERLASGVRLTQAGQELAARARLMADLAEEARGLSGDSNAELSGVIRFQTVDATAFNLMPKLKSFHRTYPNVEIELVLNQDLADLARGQADVVLRATNKPNESYVGKQVAEHAFAVFGTSELLNEFPANTPLDELPWVLWEGGLTDEWMARNVPKAVAVMRVNTAHGVAEAIQSGIGIGHLACYGVSLNEKFICLRAPDPTLSIQIWLLAHRNVRRNRKVQTFVRFLTDRLSKDAMHINGSVGSPNHPIELPLRGVGEAL